MITGSPQPELPGYYMQRFLLRLPDGIIKTRMTVVIETETLS